MKWDEYIVNPMGKKNAVFGAREMYREMYTKKFDALMVREGGALDHTLYRSKDRYYIHFKIPSEVIERFYYDVVVEFYTDDNALKMVKGLKDYDVNFYSNDPAFVYTFAHAFLKNGMFVRDLIPRMSKQAVKKVASERNPGNDVGYVKSIYFAYLWCQKKHLMNKISFEVYGEKYVRSDLLKLIMPAEEKIALRREAEERLNEKKKQEKQAAKRASASPQRTHSDGIIKTAVRTVRNTKVISGGNSTKRAKSTKRI